MQRIKSFHPTTKRRQERQTDLITGIQKFYSEATIDYSFWSKKMNMHYGYLANWKQFFYRESMLNQMNVEVMNRLKLPKNQSSTVIDAGCGVGATARYIAANNPDSNIKAINIVSAHLREAKLRNWHAGLNQQISMIYADYHHLPLPNAMADGAFAMESMCHSLNKEEWIAEMARVLKPGGRLVITDCFLQNPNKPMGRISKWAYDQFRALWHVPHLAEIKTFTQSLKQAGFVIKEVRNARWNVAPSVFHSPFVVASFLIKSFFKLDKLGAERMNNLKAVLFSIILGCSFNKFSYFIVTAEKA
ncbi:MAG: MPBQ/MSBQ methyltransferase [Bacteroidia bacterium]|jgi:MPBQ/MSBQ methyltransferase